MSLTASTSSLLDWLAPALTPAAVFGLVSAAFVAGRKLFRAAKRTAGQIEETHKELPELRAELHRIAVDTQVILENGEYAAFYCDAEGRNIEVNNNYCEMLEAFPNDLLGYGWRNFIPPEEMERYDKQWKPAMEENRAYFGKLTFQTKTGSLVSVNMRVRALEDRGQVIGYRGFMRPD